MALISSIYTVNSGRTNGTSKGLAKRNAGAKSKRWMTSVNPLWDRENSKGFKPSRVECYNSDIHTKHGCIRGCKVLRGTDGLYFRLSGQTFNVVEVHSGVYRMKGVELSECRMNQFHPASPVK